VWETLHNSPLRQGDTPWRQRRKGTDLHTTHTGDTSTNKTLKHQKREKKSKKNTYITGIKSENVKEKNNNNNDNMKATIKIINTRIRALRTDCSKHR